MTGGRSQFTMKYIQRHITSGRPVYKDIEKLIIRAINFVQGVKKFF